MVSQFEHTLNKCNSFKWLISLSDTGGTPLLTLTSATLICEGSSEPPSLALAFGVYDRGHKCGTLIVRPIPQLSAFFNIFVFQMTLPINSADHLFYCGMTKFYNVSFDLLSPRECNANKQTNICTNRSASLNGCSVCVNLLVAMTDAMAGWTVGTDFETVVECNRRPCVPALPKYHC